MAADLIIYGIVAAGLVLWLKNTLGTRHGDERQRPNPYLTADVDEEGGNVINLNVAPANVAEDQINELFENPKNNLSIDSEDAQAGLIDIAKADKSFDIARFMDAAQDAFAYIVESFAEGDRETLKDLLGEKVYAAFDGAIDQREKDGHVMEAEILGFKTVAVHEARLEGKTAYIAVRFHADEITVTRDKKDKIIAGHPERTIEMRDLWVFSRDVNSRDPRWLVTETRDDIEGDNDHIPNA